MEPADAAEHFAGEDQQLVRWYSGGVAPSVEHVNGYLSGVSHAWISGGPKFGFAICVAGGARLCGTVDADVESAGAGPGQANIAYGLYPQWRGRGLATAAVGLVLPFLRQFPLLREAVIRVDPANPSSVNVALRSGFTAAESDPDDGLLRFVRPLKDSPCP